MFVSRTQYNRLLRKTQLLELELATSQMKAVALQAKLNNRIDEWNRLIDRINRLGGERFLREAKIPTTLPQQFTPEEIKALIFLCHPDKHAGSKSASDITAKLIGLRR